ncbi:MAG: alpha-N-acetylglucosaminidase [Paludibacter sp.]|nr:alpha-N-acetylglucosaminidase [Paludibacter sp.]
MQIKLKNTYLKKLCFLFISVFWVTYGFSQERNYAEVENKQAVCELIKRTVPQIADSFEVEFMSKQADDKDIFEIESVRGKIVLRGNNGVSVASALNYYLKNFLHSSITWNGTNLNIPEKLPVVTSKVIKKSPYKYRYYLNYCTFNYSMSWWKWDRWQKEIDWMALNGINMPLAVTGQNSVWQRVYKSFGLTDKDLESFFSGPAYFNWFWMGNLDGWGGPLPQSFMDEHEVLQKQILSRERLFGMTPVLPAFTGHVPPAFKKKFPGVKLKQTSWVNFPKVNILDPSESMFDEIGRRFIEEEIHTYGTDHLYSADTFNENTPPTTDSVYLNNISEKVYHSMALADPKAVWVMQGWLFYHDRDFWKEKEIKALLNGIPDDNMIILDLWSERFPVWNRTNAYYGKPWIWNMLHNFGKNINLSGWMNSVADNPAKALNNPAAGKMQGIGLTMEGIEQNPVIYELMLENVWRDTPVKLDKWLQDYVFRRYGEKNLNAFKAWKLLSQSVYNDSITNGGAESIITARPTFAKNPGGTSTTKLPYNPAILVEAWNDLVKVASALGQSDGFRYDLVDVTRQVLADYALEVQQQMTRDYKNKDIEAFDRDSRKFVALLDDMDKLLTTRSDFLFGCWLESAKSWGTNNSESSLYEKNARNLLTLWGDKDCKLHEYACKQWAGMIAGFYKPRWEMFIRQVNSDMKKNRSFNQKKFDRKMKNWEWQWVNRDDSYSIQPYGDAIDISLEIYRKYYKEIMKTYFLNKN